jgi:hypothetical protein
MNRLGTFAAIIRARKHFGVLIAELRNIDSFFLAHDCHGGV